MMGHLLRNFWQKNDLVLSVHEAMTSQGYKIRPFLREMADNCTLEVDIDHDEDSYDHLRSELSCLTPSQCPLIFWSRSVQGQVSDLG